MGRGFLIVFSAAFLGACALPLQYQIASWAIDGISLLTTEKSIADHGISMVAQKDCALWRGVTGKEICVDNMDDAGTVLLAAARPTPSARPEVVTSIAPWQVEAAMPETTPPEPVVTVEALAVITTPAEPVEPVAALNVGNKAERLLIPGRRMWSSDLDANLYFVIGSFSERDNARQFVRNQPELGPAVMASRLDGNEIYRVAVGPFVGDQKTRISRKIKAAGLNSSWAIRIDHADWMVAARPTPQVSEPVADAVPVPVKIPKVVKPVVVDELANAEPVPPVTNPGDGNLFYVIGSFDVVDNARAYAAETVIGEQTPQASQASQASFEPVVISSKSGDKWRHRVVVGPFAEQDRAAVLGDLAQAGIKQAWSMRIPLDTPMAYRVNATSPSAPQIAGSNPSLGGSG
ncbi:MAG: SPOR domain-containing protein [Alphaproteobacteria bacterium]